MNKSQTILFTPTGSTNTRTGFKIKLEQNIDSLSDNPRY